MNAKKGLIGLSPMDGVTDTVMRQITKKYGHPDLMTTEFVNVEGYHFAKKRLAPELQFVPSEKPLIAQIYGLTPEYFAEATKDILHLGFAGVEINFGCPAKSVVHSGAGASMIKTPELAKEIVLAVQHTVGESAHHIPVSIKTRIGYEQNTAATWIPFLLALHPDRLTIHGRTLKQGYTGAADWETIGQAVHWRDQISPQTQLFGNGDINSRAQALQRIEQYQLDGVLIGRAALGNPWVFTDEQPTVATRCQVALEHCQLFEKTYGQREKYAFFVMRKHLAAYISHFPDAKNVRAALMQTTNSQQVKEIFVKADLLTLN
ncbi:tRNA-dihydrouridine synthase [bacterium]|nr:tRNA-dihydrouridine synthase [bacterium]